VPKAAAVKAKSVKSSLRFMVLFPLLAFHVDGLTT
jgi:hypothetical protein